MKTGRTNTSVNTRHHNKQLLGQLKIKNNNPVAKDIEIELPLTNSKMKELQEQDPLVGRLRKQWSEKKLDKKHFTMEDEILKKKAVINGILYTPTIVPDVLKDCFLILAHDKQGYNGFKRTYSSLKLIYNWKGMKRTIQRHCTACRMCAKHNIKVQQIQKEHFKVPPQPMEFIAMDLIGEFHAPFQQRKQVGTHGSMHANWIYFLRPDKIQESRGCYECLHR